MFIDSKGRLFGKVSIIDILIVLVLIAGIAGVGYKFTKAGKATPFAVKQNTVEVTFYGEEVPDFTANSIKEGDIARDPVQGTVFGKVTKIKADKSASFAANDKGEFVPSSKPGFASLYITTEGNALFNENGYITANNTDYYIGQYISLKVGNTAYYIRIYDIKKKG